MDLENETYESELRARIDHVEKSDRRGALPDLAYEALNRDICEQHGEILQAFQNAENRIGVKLSTILCRQLEKKFDGIPTLV